MQSGWLKETFERSQAAALVGQDTAPAAEGSDGVSRRDFLQGSVVAGAAAGMAAGGALAMQHQQAHAQPAANPFGKPWWPSSWGPADEAGASNRITPSKVIAIAVAVVAGIRALG